MDSFPDPDSEWHTSRMSSFISTPKLQASEVGYSLSWDGEASSPGEDSTMSRYPRPVRPPRPDDSFTMSFLDEAYKSMLNRASNAVPGWTVSVDSVSQSGQPRSSQRKYGLLTPPPLLSKRRLLPLLPHGSIQPAFQEYRQTTVHESKLSFTVNEETPLVDPNLTKKGKRKVSLHKYMIISALVTINFMLIFPTWQWPERYYIYVPFVVLPFVLNCIMVLNVLAWRLATWFRTPKQIKPKKAETLVMLFPCYNETPEECTKALDSLINQVGIDQHKKVILAICDGRVRGHGMEKTTAEHLTEDIFVDQVYRKMIRSAYIAWDGQSVDVEISKGTYKGVPFFCIVKQQNQGKRDSLIICRSLLHNFNLRARCPKVLFKPEIFDEMSDFLVRDAKMNHVELLIGMDANTVFGTDTVLRLMQESHYPGTLGVGGSIAVDFSHGNWNFWSLYQSAEYNIMQGLRRLHQSVVTHKVNYLPGCCQLLRVCEETCGDGILEAFGYYPRPTDGLVTRVLACASEDNNHACMMLIRSPEVCTRQAFRAYAYTDVPRSLPVFLCQRRRWSLGELANDVMLLLKAPRTFNVWERFHAFANIVVWALNPLIVAGLACLVYTYMDQPLWVTLTVLCAVLMPLCYHLAMSVWLPRNTLERCQFLVGLALFTICGPLINIAVIIYACINMDNFGWGKTRKVVSETAIFKTSNEQVVSHGYGTMTNRIQVPDEENQLTSYCRWETVHTPRRGPEEW
ncbi:glycosyltransferase family 2 protein [Xylariaceae sp. FL0662B]|nr:glycosyltransferase family 2 protein [Xylariaceae sp. FL0662B]